MHDPATANTVEPLELTPTRVALYWLPVIVALAVFCLIAIRGLRPALSEERRLGDSSAVLVDRYQRSVEESERLTRTLRAQQDPVYLERERRQLAVDPAAPGSPGRAETTGR